MKTLFSALTFAIFITCTAHAQIPPDAFNYSAVARNSEGNPITNTNLGIQISILQETAEGPVVYQENHTIETDDYGLFNLAVGTGSVLQGSMQSVEWGLFDYFLEVGMDVNGGTDFQVMGTTQLLSVPYALHAKTAETAVFSGNGFHIGMEYQGGIIFHLYSDEFGAQRGLIVSLQDLGEAEWGFYGTDVPGAGSAWDGASNTEDIVNAGGLPNEAAGLCANYSGGSFDDWYLPSVQELNMLWNNYYDVAKALNNHPDGAELLPEVYWSSTENSEISSWPFSFNYGAGFNYFKSLTYRVRAVRAF